MKTLLVLGANGKLGRLARAVWAVHPPAGWRIRSVARHEGAADLRWAPGDPASDLGHADAIVALWGVTGAGDMADNARLAQTACALGEAVGARRVLHLSSAAVYGPDGAPWREDTEPAPVSAYGKAKRDMERAIADHPAAGKSVILRVGNMVGADSLFAALSRLEAPALDRFPDGSGPRRSYLTARTLAEALVFLADDSRPVPQVLNLADDGETDMADIVRADGREPGWREAPDNAVAAATLDLARLRGVMNLDPVRAAPEGLVADWRRWRGALA